MNKKQIIALTTATILSLGVFAGCSSKEEVAFKDGTYTQKGQADDQGYADELTMEVKDGKIASIVWDCKGQDGKGKSELSLAGQYKMTEDGLTWDAQSKALSEHVVKEQSLEKLSVNDQGKTDAVTGVSINIQGFTGLVEKAMDEATK